ncbi:gamma-glutamyl-gamma-aminobutyrate hydrolase family protein [Pseudomaricurvus sp.]|uniref:gamma-glutamyl-gamma-aminobutyrate hydrolase family protein n=1 Tax=Pseudomaricurvus sp. TaxID=2004510 RepID=UPI003F6B5F07
MSNEKPLVIGLVADCKMIGLHPFHAIGDKYIRSISEGMNAIPLLIPAMGEPHLLETYLSMIDGLLLTGSPSNIEPHHYNGEPADDPQHDPARDSATLPLIKMAIDANVPLLGICRGFQEINVALGGTLHQKVQELPGMMDHREDPEQPVDVQYGLAHAVHFEANSVLAQISDSAEAQVNSVHQQGIKELAPGLNVEAKAPDGLVEAFRLDREDRFVFAVQWHPEWKVTTNPFYLSIFTAFKQACEARR